MKRTSREKISKVSTIKSKLSVSSELIELNNHKPTESINIMECSTQQLQNRHSFQVHVEHSWRQTICWVIKQILTNSNELKSYNVCSLIIMELNFKSVVGRDQCLWWAPCFEVGVRAQQLSAPLLPLVCSLLTLRPSPSFHLFPGETCLSDPRRP